MAQKRMFSKDVVRTDRFLDMPLSAQALYFHLSLDADVKGFVTPGLVMRITRAQPDDLNVLIGKNFVVPFETGVMVVTHWNVNNNVRDSREAPSQFVQEISNLKLTEQGTYVLLDNSRSTPGVLLPSIDEYRGGEYREIIPPISPKGDELDKEESFTPEQEEMQSVWKDTVGTTLRNNMKENLSSYRYLKKEVGDITELLQAVRLIRADKFQKRSLQGKLINYIGLKEKLEEVEAYMAAHVNSRKF